MIRLFKYLIGSELSTLSLPSVYSEISGRQGQAVFP